MREGKKQESRQYIYKRLLEAGINSDCADDIVSGLDSDTNTCLQLFDASFPGGSKEDYLEREDEFFKLAQLRGYNNETARTAFKMFIDSL